MNTYEVKVTRRVQAEAEAVYAVLSDYRTGHPAILPPRYYRSLVVEEGGIGSGTVVSVEMTYMGAVSRLRLFVTEPEPGRVLREEDPAAGVTTYFVMEPDSVRGGCAVTIRTVWKRKKGVMGWIESKVNPPAARKIFAAELEQIGRYCEER